jgi:soluble cytochrome b562
MANESKNPFIEGLNAMSQTLQRQQASALAERAGGTQKMYALAQMLQAVSQTNQPMLDSSKLSKATGGVIKNIIPGKGVANLKADTQLSLQESRDKAAKAKAEFEASKKTEADVLKFAKDMEIAFGNTGSASEVAKQTRTAIDAQKTVAGKQAPVRTTQKEYGRERKGFKLFGKNIGGGGTITEGELIDIYGRKTANQLSQEFEAFYDRIKDLPPEKKERPIQLFEAYLKENYPELDEFKLKIQ